MFFNRLLSISNLLFQCFLTLAVLLAMYMAAAFQDYLGDSDLISMIGFLVFQPLLGAIVSVVTILICLLIGMPIRLNTRINNWWKEHQWLAGLGLLSGVMFFMLAFYFKTPESIWIEDTEVQRMVPDLMWVTAGWFTVAFCLLHFYPATLLPKKIGTR